MDDLIAFLRARLDEREAKAKAALPGPWVVEEHTYETVVTSDDGRPVASVDALSDGWHIADNDPKFVLAEVDAKRRMVDVLADAIRRGQDDYDLATELAPLMAAEWSAHPDYREEWRP